MKSLWELEYLKVRAAERKIKHASFREPDLNDELTAIAFAPGDKSKRLLSGIPLALKTFSPEEQTEYLTQEEIIQEMESCFQFENINMLQHGEMVWDWYQYLIRCLKDPSLKERSVKIPEWFYENSELLLELQRPEHIVKKYAIFHDCGKPFCKTVDSRGRQHFLNHAEVSAKTYFNSFEGEDKIEIATLIARDMDIHKLKAKGVKEFSKRKDAATLLITGLAEIHANAAMFGGIDSTSFKIKWKHIDRRGRAICKELKEDSLC